MTDWLARFRQHRRDNPLALRLLAYILLFSSLITLISTATQVWLDYRNDLDLINDRLRQLEATSLDTLATEIWLINDERIALQLESMSQLPDIQQLELTTQYGEHFLAGRAPDGDIPLLEKRYPLEHVTNEGERYALGELIIRVSLERVFRDLRDRVLVILASQGVKTFLVSIFILWIFWKLVTRHLSALSRYAATLTPERLDQPLRLDRQSHEHDELERVVDAINRMRLSLQDDIARREAAEAELARLNAELEQRVEQRTEQLQLTNQELLETLEQLRNTQKQLVESEKMAALGNLVAGVAHEINTPIGIGVTAATWLRDQARAEQRQPTQDPERWRSFVESALESSELITTNLERAAQLVRAFKQVSVDQSSEQARLFDLRGYLNEVLVSLAPQLRQRRPEIELICAEGLMIYSYPGAIYQILVNLIQNSLVHGFEDNGGRIRISARARGNEFEIDYQDSGKGISEADRVRVFDPFYTTRRNQGCSGLGLHISYNLASQLLRGTLRCLPPDKLPGAHFQLRFRSLEPDQPSASASWSRPLRTRSGASSQGSGT